MRTSKTGNGHEDFSITIQHGRYRCLVYFRSRRKRPSNERQRVFLLFGWFHGIHFLRNDARPGFAVVESRPATTRRTILGENVDPDVVHHDDDEDIYLEQASQFMSPVSLLMTRYRYIEYVS